MKSLVTGGAGFIGSHLVNRLVQLGHDVIVLDNFSRGNKLDRRDIQCIQLIEGDVRNADLVRDAVKSCDWVFHLAAVLGVDIVADNPVECMETEVFGLRNVVNAAIAHGVEKVIYASTSGVYGKAAIERAVDEEFQVSPNSSYAIAKRYNEIYLKSVKQERNLNSVSLRFFNVYGPRQDNRMVIPRFFEQAIASKDITVFGTGKQTRDFTYIDDVVEGIVRVASLVNGCEVVNIANSKEEAIIDVARQIVKLCNSKSEITLITPPQGRYDFEVERRRGSSAKLESLTGYGPDTPFEVGLRRVYEHIIGSAVAPT